ncbi:hypothetical protein LTR17_015231 [Elasticomyces elasticus]|nr:hypothetical protein LTR17_015231 [Elasticomyces elasticus]
MKACAALGLVALANAAAIDTAPGNRPVTFKGDETVTYAAGAGIHGVGHMSFANKDVANGNVANELHRPHKSTLSWVDSAGTTHIRVDQPGVTSCTTKHGQTSWTDLYDGHSASGHFKHGSEVKWTQVLTGSLTDGGIPIARSAPAPGCCFQINAFSNGGPNGAVDQLSDGQNRVGQTGLTRGKYCIDGNGGFSVSCDGTLVYHGSSTFYTCPTGDHGGWNLYSKPVWNQDKCMPITLKADSCFSGCTTLTSSIASTTMSPSTISSKSASTPSSTSTHTIFTTKSITSTVIKHASSTVTPTTVTSTSCSTLTVSPSSSVASSSSAVPPPPAKPSCPANLIGTNFEFPHLIVALDRVHQSMQLGNSLNGYASPNVSSLFNFDIPASDAGKMCTLKFILPAEGTMETSRYELSGSGHFNFAALKGSANKDMTYGSAPAVKKYMKSIAMVPGNAYTIDEFMCPAGEQVGFSMSSTGSASLEYFQDFNPCPVGLYITVA